MNFKEFFTAPNPKYYQLIKLDKKPWNTPKAEYLGTSRNYPPGYGYWYKVYNGVKNSQLPDIPKKQKEILIDLYPNQKEVFDKIKNVRAALVDFKTGSGKTVIITALTEFWEEKTLILAHSKDNVEYFYDTFDKFTWKKIGRYYSAKKELKDITVTTFHTAIAYPELFYNHGFKNLIIDEADICFTKRRRDFVTDFPCLRRIGFTGTTKTKYDGLSASFDEIPSLQRYYGLHIEGVSEESKNPIKYCFYRTRETQYTDEFGIEIPAKDWINFKKLLDEDVERKREQADYIKQNYSRNGDYILALFDRVDDVEKFYNHFKKNGYDRIYKMHGKISKKEREENKKLFLQNGGIYFAQYVTAGRGLDLPECNKLFILFPSKNENTVRQMVGRIIRWLPEKESTIYDWIDSSLLFQGKSRIKIYKKFFNLNPEEI